MAAMPEGSPRRSRLTLRVPSVGLAARIPRRHAQWRERREVVFIQLALRSSETGPNGTVLQRDETELIEQRS